MIVSTFRSTSPTSPTGITVRLAAAAASELSPMRLTTHRSWHGRGILLNINFNLLPLIPSSPYTASPRAKERLGALYFDVPRQRAGKVMYCGTIIENNRTLKFGTQGLFRSD